MSARLVNTSVHRRCAGLCSIYAKAHAAPWWIRQRGTPSDARRAVTTRSVVTLDALAPRDQVDRAILCLLLDDQNAGALRAAALPKTLKAAGLDEMISAITRLKAQGVLEIRADRVELSTCVRRIAELGLIAK